MYLIGYDIGSSSVKACVVDAQTGKTLSTAFYPKQEAPILSLKAGWAEQEPESWWNYLKSATAEAMAATAEKAGRPVSALKEGLGRRLLPEPPAELTGQLHRQQTGMGEGTRTGGI